MRSVTGDRSSLLAVEIASILILAFFLAFMAKGGLLAGSKDGRPRSMRAVLYDIAVIAVASWVGEVTCIRWYAFYQYDAPWTFFIDVMPLLVALIWPFVLLSARELVHRSFSPRLGRGGVLALFVIVLYDAALIEPVAVRAGLWSWNEPGLFGVPVIGIVGWAYFGAVAAVCIDRLDGPAKLLTILIAPAVTHVLLVASWWGCLKWILRLPISAPVAAGFALGIALCLGVVVKRSGKAVGLEVMAPRMAAASLFMVLLFLRGSDTAPLLVYGLTFAIPYLLATRWKFDRFGARRVADEAGTGSA